MDYSTTKTRSFLRNLRTRGRFVFTMDELLNDISKPEKNIRKDIDRLRVKKGIVNIRRGFYTILPEEFQNMGIIPVDYFIDDLMKYLSKDYYVGLLSAAMFHGATHQQPQVFYVISQSPKPRNISRNNVSVHFSEKTKFPKFGIDVKKTVTGYFKISNAELTFLDLIYFEAKIGGYNRIITIMQELVETIDPIKMEEVVKNEFPLSTFQKAGYISEKILNNDNLASVFENRIRQQKTSPVLFKASAKKEGIRDDKWNVIINIKIESDL